MLRPYDLRLTFASWLIAAGRTRSTSVGWIDELVVLEGFEIALKLYVYGVQRDAVGWSGRHSGNPRAPWKMRPGNRGIAQMRHAVTVVLRIYSGVTCGIPVVA
jgi:hypothetical protein